MRNNKRIQNNSGSSESKGIGTMNIILIIVGVALLAFTVVMIFVFLIYGSIPDTLCTCVFAALGGECGVMGMIKSTKEKYKEREWQKEDEQSIKAEEAPACDADADIDGRDPNERGNV